jgi:predicted nucleic acid-binding protein
MPTTIIADSSTLIAFLKVHRLDLLESLFGELVIPPAVAVEVPTLPNTSWIRIHTAPFPIESLPVALGAGRTRGNFIGRLSSGYRNYPR